MRKYESPVGSGHADRGVGSNGENLDPEEIRVEIAQTRTEMSGTIDAIQQRLAPDVLTEQAKDIARDATDHAKTAAQEVLQDAVREVKDAAKEVTAHAVHEVKDAALDVTTGAKDAAWDATVGRAEDAVSSAGDTAKGLGATVIETIKQNPIPAALAGLSLFWLYKNRGSTSSSQKSRPYRTSGSYPGTGTAQAYPIRTGYASEQERREMMTDAERKAAGNRGGYSAPHREGEADESMMSNASQMVSDAASSAGSLASDAASTIGNAASDVASSTTHMASTAGESAMDAGSSIVGLIQRNPVPAALVGIGLGWLYMNRSDSQPDYRAHSGTQNRYGQQGMRSYGYDGAASRTGEHSEGVGGAVSRATERVGDVASSAQERVGDMADTVMEQTRRAPGRLERMIQERPLMAAAVAASLGGLVGMSFPVTDAEHSLMGSANEQVMHRAQEVASDTMEKVQDVAQEVRSTVSEESRASGLIK